MTIQEWFDKYNNTGIDDDGYYGFQCMDLAHRYAKEVIGKDFAPAPAAKDVWNQTIDGYDKIPNTPTGVPTKGDIIIWGTAIGAYGHIAVFDHGDSNSFTSFDQNWPLNSLCHYQNHNYTGVLGWFHPRILVSQDLMKISKADFENLMSKSTKYDAFLKDGFPDVTLVHKAIDDATQVIRDKDSEIDSLKTLLFQYQHPQSPPTSSPMPSQDLLTAGKLHQIIYKTWSSVPTRSDYWKKRLHEAKAIFES